MITAVIFDLYETLVTQSGVDVPRAGALGESFGLDATAYRKQWKQLRPLALRGELTFREALTKVGTTLGANVTAERIQRACDDRIRANTAVFETIDPELLAVTSELAARGARLATISNCMAEDVAAWPGCAYASHFACAVFSFDAGTVKPDPQIYLAAVRRLGVNPGDALYIGDGGDDELAGAARAGLRVAQAGWFVARPITDGIPFLARPRDAMRIVGS